MDVSRQTADPAAANARPEDGPDYHQSQASDHEKLPQLRSYNQPMAPRKAFQKPSSMKVVFWMRANRA